MLITAENLNFGYAGEPLLEGLCFTLNEGERAGVVGGNGEGKTTLIRLILGELTPDSGTLFKKNGIRIGYLAQNGGYDSENTAYEEMRGVFAEDIRLLEALSETEEEISRCAAHDRKFAELSARYESLTKRVAARDSYNFEVKLKTVLNGMGFAERYEQKISTMSGGEKTRLKLCRLLLEEPELLILDEPTNHLDMRSKDVLKEAVKEFDGTVIVVSHDREFLDGLVTKVYEFGGGLVKEHIGGIYDFLQKKKMENLNELQLSQSPQTASPKKEEPAESESKLSYEAQKELNKKIRKLEKQVADCEAKIEKLEEQVAQLEEQMATPEGASDMKLYEQHQQLKKQIAEAEEEWTLLLSELEEMK